MLANSSASHKTTLQNEIHKITSEVQLRQYGLFLERYESDLESILDAMEFSTTSQIDFDKNLIKLDLSLNETISMNSLPVEYAILNKVVQSFITLCVEIKLLNCEARDKYYNLIMLYGEAGEEKTQEYIEFSKLESMLKVLNDLCVFVNRCQTVVVEIIAQLNCLSKSDHLSQFSYPGATEIDIFYYMCDMLLVLITIEEILQNSIILDHWKMYRRTVKSVHRSHSTFNLDLNVLDNLDEILNYIENQLLSENIIQSTINKCVHCLYQSNNEVNKVLEKRFYSYIRILINDLEKCDPDLIDTEKSTEWVKLNVLYIFYIKLFKVNDKKFFKILKGVNKKVPCVTLVGNIVWCSEQFLSQHSNIIKGFDQRFIQEMNRVKQTYLQNKTQNLLKDSHNTALQIFTWILEISAILQEGANNLKLEHLTQRTHLLLQGLTHACYLNYTIKSITNLHMAQNKPMTKSCLLSVCKLVELLKAVHQIFSKYIGRTFTFERSLHGPSTERKIIIAHLALSCINVTQVFHDDNLSKLIKDLKYIQRIQNFQEYLDDTTDCSFLFWHQSILPAYFSNVYENKMDISKIYYMFQALNDFEESEEYKESYMKTIDSSLNEKILEPLCSQVETDLRLQIHSHLQPGLMNPFDDGTPEVSNSLLELNPILCGQKYIDIKGHVENYLDSMFYNLTTVVLFDWKTYGEMRRLANEKFFLHTIEDHLPTQTLEQGLDVLEIMRNMHIFVAKYLYNLNNQIFVEKWSNNKHLNTINIQHVANSIRTHGTGTMNTTINLTYQFLKKKFFVFSQFLYDEHIKSRLLKDLRYFREHKTESNPMYSYDRAYNFNKAIRKLGISSTGQSYLDHFRLLITHLGNAMGYVRMIRSGGLHSCSNASVFLPVLDENKTFEELCQANCLSETVCQAAHVLEQDIRNLACNFAEGSEYFKLLVDVFAPVFRNPRNIHLRNFYIIVPSLTINFVEHLITAKDKLTKKDKSGAAFTDDGFAMGLAYILKLLDQNSEMDSLHWFQSVSEKCNQEKQILAQQKVNASRDDKTLQHTLSLTTKRLELFQQEFKLLYYSFSSARIFFQ
ncbi:WASH complex subunit 4-like [Ctenocephalides felis]|uniref:WASH complex subunit 4-like n=1 Tax=Ctenocephalides felis TaxID=7515 RepID=UPI000E6E3A94|nr:WASH complex subunit 4-like [Ctenocephalides felis]